MKQLVETWFASWEAGDVQEIPVDPDFRHVSPYGTIEGRDAYLSLVEANLDSFLGHRFEIRDALYESDRACVRYTTSKGDWSMEVAEWFYLGHDRIGEIVSYYNVGRASYAESFDRPPDR